MPCSTLHSWLMLHVLMLLLHFSLLFLLLLCACDGPQEQHAARDAQPAA
jgi:hypothetical protein